MEDAAKAIALGVVVAVIVWIRFLKKMEAYICTMIDAKLTQRALAAYVKAYVANLLDQYDAKQILKKKGE